MLKRLKIKNFKSVLEADLSFGRVNLFVGGNGSGKSNILEALGVLSCAMGRGILPIDLDAKGVRLSLPHLFKSTFKNRRIPKTFRFEAEFEDIEYFVSLTAGEDSASLFFLSEELREQGKKIFGRSPHGAKLHQSTTDADALAKIDLPTTRGAWDVFSLFAEISEKSAKSIDSFAKYAIYSPQTAVMRGISSDARAVEPLGLSGNRLATAFKETLNFMEQHTDKDRIKRVTEILKVIWESGWATQIKIRPPDPEIVPDFVAAATEMVYIKDKYMRGGRNFLSPYDASEGTLYLIFVATLLAHPETPRIFALDNVDGTLNPRLVRNLVEHIVRVVCSEDSSGQADNSDSRSDRQVFLTSHNPTALDALDLFNDDHRVFVVHRDEKTGSTICDPLLPPTGMTKAKWISSRKGKTLSQLWLEGRIPNL